MRERFLYFVKPKNQETHWVRLDRESRPSTSLEVIGEIPFDDDLRRAEQKRTAPLETNARALGDIRRVAAALVS